MSSERHERTLRLFGATIVGVGAIVGGGVLVLGGTAFDAAGPSAIFAFLLNGIVAGLTALSFAEMSGTFPESGGAYVFAKKVLSVRAAFAVGWILWFAYIVAGVLYALGFAEFGAEIVRRLFEAATGSIPAAVASRRLVTALAVGASAAYTLALIRRSAGGGEWATIGKVVVFAVLILAGIWALPHQSLASLHGELTPLMPHGTTGLLKAMGLTFIGLQGFEVIAAVAGDVHEPGRTIPRAMFISLGIALLVYLPLMFLAATVGTAHGETITQMAAAHPETLMADAVRTFMGPVGYWLVMIAAVLSTLSALHASLLAASRVASTMAVDRTLPRVLAEQHASWRTPIMAIYASELALVAILFMVPNLAAAGAAASLIFLVSFALAHVTSYLARRRSASTPEFATPWFPAVQVGGGIACTALAIYQAVAVPAAGGIAAVWLGLGVILYFSIFASRAEAADAFAQAHDPALVRLRGLNPLVLVPIANPDNAAAMVGVANALSPPKAGRVLLLTVVRRDAPGGLDTAQRVLSEALTTSLESGHAPEALLTIADQPWPEIARVAGVHRCESLLLGLSRLDDPSLSDRLEELINDADDADVAVLRAKPGWKLDAARTIVVPIGGRGGHDELRARLLGSLCRGAPRAVTFVRVMPASTDEETLRQAERDLLLFAEVEAPGKPKVRILANDDVAGALTQIVAEYDLVVLGMQRVRGRRAFGRVALAVAAQTETAAIMLSTGD